MPVFPSSGNKGPKQSANRWKKWQFSSGHWSNFPTQRNIHIYSIHTTIQQNLLNIRQHL